MEHSASVFISKEVAAASLTLLSYESLITFSDEVQLIWSVPWTIPKVLYFLAKYPAIAYQIILLYFSLHHFNSPEACNIYLKLGTVFALWGYFATQSILLLRTLALHRGNKRIYYFLGSLWTISLIVAVAVLAVWAAKLKFFQTSNVANSGCGYQSRNALILIDFIIIIIWECAIFYLALLKAWREHLRSRSSLLRVLWQDGFHYYLYATVSSIAAFTTLFTLPPPIWSIFASLQRVIHIICGTRILLHVSTMKYKNYRYSCSPEPRINSHPFGVAGDEDQDDKDARMAMERGMRKKGWGVARRLSTVFELEEVRECEEEEEEEDLSEKDHIT